MILLLVGLYASDCTFVLTCYLLIRLLSCVAERSDGNIYAVHVGPVAETQSFHYASNIFIFRAMSIFLWSVLICGLISAFISQ